MSFGENLQFYRKKESVTQEQLAEKMGVSRQTVSKWESDASYPEMDKLVQLCDLFGCSIDMLMRGDASQQFQEDQTGYDSHMNLFTWLIVFGVSAIIAGVGLECILETFLPEVLCNVVMMACILLGVLLLVYSGLDHNHFCEKYPYIPPFYEEEEIERFERRFILYIVVGVGIILLGVLLQLGLETIPKNVEGIRDGAFILMIAVAVAFFIYGGMQKSKYHIEIYNKESEKKSLEEEKQSKSDAKIGMLSACIMLTATLIYVLAGFLRNMWGSAWIVFIAGGILCGIVSIILKCFDEK